MMSNVPIASTRIGQPFSEHFRRNHLCAECNGELIEATTDPYVKGMLWVGCGLSRSHQGFKKRPNFRDVYPADGFGVYGGYMKRRRNL